MDGTPACAGCSCRPHSELLETSTPETRKAFRHGVRTDIAAAINADLLAFSKRPTGRPCGKGRRHTMKIVVIGGTGLIGTRVVKRLTEQGHQALAASPNTGVDATTGRGLAEALAGAQVVVDLSNS